MKKRIIFFDADGTLWYPKSTRHTQHPVWLWRTHGQNIEEAKKELTLTPGVRKTLVALRKKGVKLVVLSTSPFPPKEAAARVRSIITHLKLSGIFTEVHGTKEYRASKAEFIMAILKKYHLKKGQAIMVGDSYEWDYKPAKDMGIAALLVASDYERGHHRARRIKGIGDVLDLV